MNYQNLLDHYWLATGAAAFFIFAGMMVFMEAGRRLSLRKAERRTLPGEAAVENAIYALLGLLMAFTFSGAAERINSRNLAAIQEANALGTAYQRMDLLPEKDGNVIKKLLLDYTTARVSEYESIKTPQKFAEARARTYAVRNELWTATQQACEKAKYPNASLLVLPALNEVFNAAYHRELIRYIHPPLIIYFMIFIISLLAAILAGHRMADNRIKSWMHRVAFAGVIALTMFITLHMECPRYGFIDMNNEDAPLKSAMVEMSQNIK